MKKVQTILYEKGDYIRVLTGYSKGRVGTVVSHRAVENNVEYMITGKGYDNADDGYNDDYELSQSKHLEYLTKAEYDKILLDLKILNVPGLPVSIQYKGKSLIIGDNVITAANAKKIAEFINKHTKGK